jgi:hypothetical protein
MLIGSSNRSRGYTSLPRPNPPYGTCISISPLRFSGENSDYSASCLRSPPRRQDEGRPVVLVTVTDVTRMRGTRVCVAGYLQDWTCVRPEPFGRDVDELWLYNQQGVLCRPFAQLDLYRLRRQPTIHPPHTEDLAVGERYEYRGLLGEPERLVMLRHLDDGSVRAIFGAPLQREPDAGSFWIDPGTGDRSLGTIRIASIDRLVFGFGVEGKTSYRLSFADASGEHFNLPVTDLSFRAYLDYHCATGHDAPWIVGRQLQRLLNGADEVWLRVGLARPWQRPGTPAPRCYLQVTGVYSFPDYLGGRCFADFMKPPASVVDPSDDVPF